MREGLRTTGIAAVGEAPWGTHFCQFYRTPQDLLDILIPYFKAGLESNEFCMWITSEPLGASEAREAMRKEMPDLDSYIESGQLEILPHSAWYLKDGYFDSQRVLDGWMDRLERALSRGFEGLRLTGNTFWLEKDDWEGFTQYEEAIDNVIGFHRIMAVCTYSAEKCSVAEVVDVIKNHQFALIKREGKWEIVQSAERKRSEAEREVLLADISRRAAELEVANKELEAFSYSVSHDLRAPLRGIDGFSQALEEEYGDRLDDRGREYLGIVRSESQRMAALIDALLTLSRITRAEMRRETVDLSDIVEKMATKLRRAEPERPVEFVITPGLEASGDPQLLKVALENLLANSWKFSSKRPRARIEFGVTDAAENRVYFVRDDGAGFDMTYASKLFGAFQRLHSQNEFSGTGIGLATVQRIIHRHGGRIWAEGEVEKGATFYFSL